jgi:uncharacterized repeat protein (TIGR03803 family)
MSLYRSGIIAVLLCLPAAAQVDRAPIFTTLANFDGTNGADPGYVSLVQGTDGSFYGTTQYGGTYGNGTIFKIATSGIFSTLYSFNSTDGNLPIAGLVEAADAVFYGTTYQGGAHNYGTIFKVTSGGSLTALYSFTLSDGANPMGALVQDSGGKLYGTTVGGGDFGYGTVFNITPSGTLTTLYSFNGVDGAYPFSSLVPSASGVFYGTTYGTVHAGGTNYGTLFRITPDGSLTNLHSFNGLDGSSPVSGLVQAANGAFYGTTSEGGTYAPSGTIFRIAPNGTFATLYNFSAAGGNCPTAGLIQATDGNIYGTTVYGGANTGGTIFRMSPGGNLKLLYNFASDAYPWGGLLQGTDGKFYGVTQASGTSNYGIVYRLSVGLRPFIRMLPPSGRIGTKIRILGTDLTGATSVSFNGTPAAFTVISTAQIVATIPEGASSGTIQVVTPRGTLASNVPFQIL